jgi:ABC-2 type transport system permease protein
MYDIAQTQTGGNSITGIAFERRITSALLFAEAGETPVVYEITGHAEIPLSAVGFHELIERDNFSLKSLNLLLSAIPSDASVLILNGPSSDLTPSEAEKILDYLESGGRFLVLADYNIQELSGLNEVLYSYGIKFDYGIIHETDPYYVAIDPRSEWPDLLDHEITKPLADKSRTPVVLLEAMALSALETKRRSVEITPLAVSSSSAFLRTNLDDTSAEKAPSDISGPVLLGAAVKDPSFAEGNTKQTRIVAIGAGSLLPLATQGFDANRDLFLNSLTWLGDRPETISARSKSLFLMPLRINLVQLVIFGMLFIFVVPAGFFITGLVTWLRRRHL